MSATDPLRHSPYLARSVMESPVGLVVVQSGERMNAMTVSLFSEAAHYPTSMWVSIAPTTHTHELLAAAGRFSFVTLRAGQARLAAACGTASGRDTDKCAGLDLYDGGNGFLFLRDALACTACVVDQSRRVGDHTLFIARMLSGAFDGRRSAERHLLLSDLRAL